MVYNLFAEVYDELMDETLYKKWENYTSQFLSPTQKVLELGCGTGILGLHLQNSGYKMTGLDLSEDMLASAYNRQLESDTHFPLLNRDMRDLSDLPQYDGIICYGDSLCYLETKEDVLRVFKEAYKQLHKGGYFLFDVHSIYQISLFLNQSFHSETENIVFLWDSFEGEYVHSVEHDLTYLVEKKDGLYEKFEDVHKERTYPIEEYKQLLKEAGFTDVTLSADFTETVKTDSKRWFFASKK